MSRYPPGHEGHDPYIDYASQSEANPEERVYGSHIQDMRHGGPQGLSPLHELAAHQQQQHQHHQHQQHIQQQQQQAQHQHPSHQVILDPHVMSHHQSPPFGSGQPMLPYGARRMHTQMQPQMQQATGSKRQRDDLEAIGMGSLQEGQMQSGDMHSISPQGMVGYGGQPVQQSYHGHTLPNQEHRSKIPRMGDPESSMLSQGGAPSVVGLEGMPPPAQRPRGPKLKFTPEDDQLLVDLKENKSLTWKQIAEFFPGRSSGTLQVRYCTKLKAKTTQWTDETIQKLRQALHDYEQEKWRIIAQKVGTGFTSAACKEKAMEL
ncbi:hypothetical protein BJ878DRAFT_279553 [Calycina marina]|uniref:Myb-like domain-containing protein n=1 Tax=Calycina marina TaxID=1763456 RepID=A0A9P7Z7Q7_9HELO|nr:hypothetical protein BJ878DRAFT_279553 [Calycina marina]